MKAGLISLALLCSLHGAFSQGVVNFRNDNLSSPPDRLIRCADMTTGLIGTTFAAQLLFGTDPASLTPHPTLAYFRASLSPGTWSGGNRTLTGIAAPSAPTPAGPGLGPVIWLEVRVWDSGPGRTVTFDQARASGGFHVSGPVFSYQQRLSSPPDTLDTAMHNFVGFSTLSSFNCIPEPAIPLLLLPAIAGVWLLKRRTNI